jgi:hypothetical protein
MNWQDVVSNVNIYGLEESVRGAEEEKVSQEEVTERNVSKAQKLGADSFLNGVIVQFDLTFTNKAWVQAERYHFLDFVNMQSTMHRITQFDLNDVYNEYVDTRIIDIMKEKTRDYNELQEDIKARREEGKDVTTLTDLANQKYLAILYSNPAGFKMTARMTTNYRQLKVIYFQRRDHRLPEWRAFCQWIETLPRSEFITHAE